MPNRVGGNTEQFFSKPKKAKEKVKPNSEPLPNPDQQRLQTLLVFREIILEDISQIIVVMGGYTVISANIDRVILAELVGFQAVLDLWAFGTFKVIFQTPGQLKRTRGWNRSQESSQQDLNPRFSGVPTGSSIQNSPLATVLQLSIQACLLPAFQSMGYSLAQFSSAFLSGYATW
jgi:hypothetical protein